MDFIRVSDVYPDGRSILIVDYIPELATDKVLKQVY